MFIKLTSKYGRTLHIDISHIIAVTEIPLSEEETETVVYTSSGECFDVIEYPEEVLKQIEETKSKQLNSIMSGFNFGE